MTKPKRIFFVSCVKVKKTVPAPAGELYISDWFSKARNLVKNAGSAWYILSAKHGLISPDTIIEPYDVTLNKIKMEDRRDWAARVREQMTAMSFNADEAV